MIGDEQSNFKPGSGVNQVFALRKRVEKVCEQDCKVCVGFVELEKAYEQVYREAA